jgi:hypothetical protein
MAPPIVIGGAAGPADLTAARIRRANPSIGREAARELAADLHDIVGRARALGRAEGFSAAIENGLIQTMMREIVDDRPPGDAAAYDDGANASMYLASMLTDPDSPEDLYLRYMRLFDRINGTDIVGECDLDGPSAKKPELCLVRDDLPPLEALKQAVIAAVRLAQKGESSNKILELVSAFRHATGLYFIMNATEAHREALFDLAQKAGIPVKS